MLQPFELSGPDICCHMFFNTHFRHTNACSCESNKVFETENVSTWGGLKPLTFGFMPNALTIWAIRARHLLSHIFLYWLGWYRYFWSKINIWKVNCGWITAFIFDTRTDVLVKVSKFLRQKMSRPEGHSNTQPSDSCRRSNYLRYQGQTFAVPCFWILALFIWMA